MGGKAKDPRSQQPSQPSAASALAGRAMGTAQPPQQQPARAAALGTMIGRQEPKPARPMPNTPPKSVGAIAGQIQQPPSPVQPQPVQQPAPQQIQQPGAAAMFAAVATL